MKKLLILLFMAVGLAVAACNVNELGVPGGSVSSSSSSSSGFVLPESTPTNCLILQSLSPATNSVVTSNTTVTATLEYVIASNETTAYQFALLQIVEMTTPGFYVVTTNLALADRHGTATFTLPLGNIWSLPGITHPIAMKFSLCNFSDASSSTELFVISNIIFSE